MDFSVSRDVDGFGNPSYDLPNWLIKGMIMIYRELGSSGIEVSAVAFGAWAIGGWMWGGVDEDEAIDAIQAALDAGVNVIDTAPIYGFGRSEEIVGRAIRDRRDKVVLATKCGMVWDREEGQFFFHTSRLGIAAQPSEMEVFKCLRPASIRQELERSLKRLGTDHVDLYQTHWQESTTPIADTMGELLRLKKEGKIRAIGVCNANVEHMRAYGPIDSDQEKFSLLDREIEQENLPYCRRESIAVLAYSPLANGLLTERMRPDRQVRRRRLASRQSPFHAGTHRSDQRLARAASPDRRPPQRDGRAVGDRLDVLAAGAGLCAVRRPQPAAGHRQRRRRRPRLAAR